MQTLDYDLFDLKTADKPPLSLDEAVSQAAELRHGNADFFRVVPIDLDKATFRVERVTSEKVYSDFLASIFKFCGRMMRPVTR